jgi:hypothetical protein
VLVESNAFECLGFKAKPYANFLGTPLFRLPSGNTLPVAVYREGGQLYFADNGLDPARQPLTIGEATHEIQTALRETLREICPELFITGDAP